MLTFPAKENCATNHQWKNSFILWQSSATICLKIYFALTPPRSYMCHLLSSNKFKICHDKKKKDFDVFFFTVTVKQ